MRIMIIVLIAVLSNQLYSQPPQWSLYLTASSECANSQNGTITVTMQLGQTVPNVGPYQLPWDVSYEEINNGDFGTEKMYYNGHQIRMLKKGTYKVTVYFNNECYAEGIVEVPEEPNGIIVTPIKSDISCENSKGSIILTTTGGLGNYIYEWDNGSTQSQIINLEIGEYCYTVTDEASCKAEECLEILDLKGCDEVFDYVVINKENSNNKGSINCQTPQQSPNITYLWTGPDDFKAATRNIENLEPGRYCYRAICCNEIVAQDCYEVLGPCFGLITNITDPVEYNCNEAILTITIPNFSENPLSHYIYIDGDHNSRPTNSFDISGYPPGIHHIKVVKISDYCFQETTFMLNPNQNPNDLIEYNIEAFEPGKCNETKGKVKIFTKRTSNTNTRVDFFNVNTLLTETFYIASNIETLIELVPGTYTYKIYFENSCNKIVEQYITIRDLNEFILNYETENPKCGLEGRIKISGKTDEVVVAYIDNGYRSTKPFKASVIIEGKKPTYLVLPYLGNYNITDGKCFKSEPFNIIQEFNDIDFKLKSSPDNVFTIEPDGVIKITDLPNLNICNSPLKYHISVKDNLSCKDIFDLGKEVNPKEKTELLLSGFEGNTKYYVYIYCGGCCSRKEIFINYSKNNDSRLLVTSNCEPNNNMKLEFTGDWRPNLFNYILYWYHDNNLLGTTIGNDNQNFYLVKNSGNYCVELFNNNYWLDLKCIDVPDRAEVIIDEYNPDNSCDASSSASIKVHVNSTSNFTGPFSYLWLSVENPPEIKGNCYTPSYNPCNFNPPENKKYRLEVTSANGCKISKIFDFPCCDANHYDFDCQLWEYSWTGPRNFKSNKYKITNLEAGYYTLKYKPKNDNTCLGSERHVYLNVCNESDLKFTYNPQYFCNLFDQIQITIEVSGGVGPYYVDFPSGQYVSTSGNKVTFKGLAYLLNNKIITVRDLSGCTKTGLCKLSYNLSKFDYSDINKTPPECNTGIACNGNVIRRYNNFVFKEYVNTSDPVYPCRAVFTCGLNEKTFDGNIKSEIIKNPNTQQCFEWTYCVFPFQEEIKVNYSSPRNVSCPQEENGKGKVTNDETCEGYIEITVPNTNLTYKFSYTPEIRNFYCRDKDNRCVQYKLCGYLDNNGKFVIVKEISEWYTFPFLCITPGDKYMRCPIFLFTKNPTDIFYSPIDSNFYVVGYINGSTEIFIKKYDPDLNNTLNTNLQFNTDGINPSSLNVNSLVDNGNILQVSTTTFGNVTIEGNTTSLIDGNARLVNIGRDLNILGSNNLPYNGWQQVISQKTSNTGQKLMLIKGSTNLNNTPQVGQVDSGQLYLVNYLPSGFVNSTIPITSNSLNTIAGFDLMSSGQAVVAYSSLAGIVLNVVSNNQIVQSSLIPMPITSSYKTLDLVTTPTNIFVLLTLPNQNSIINSMLIKMDNNLNIIWSKQFEGGLNVDLSKIAYFNDQLVVTGNFSGEYVLPTGDTLNSIGMDPLALVLDMGGNIINYVTGSGTGDDMAVDLTITPSGKAVLMGCYKGSSLTIGDKVFDESDPLNKIFVYGFTLNTPIPIISDNRIEAENDLINITKVYPNPTNGDLNVEISSTRNEKNVSLSIYDLNGKKIYLQEVNIRRGLKNSYQVSCNGIASGFYYLILEDQKGNKTVKKFGKF